MGAYLEIAFTDQRLISSHRERPEDIASILGQEGKRVLQYIHSKCGKLEG